MFISDPADIKRASHANTFCGNKKAIFVQETHVAARWQKDGVNNADLVVTLYSQADSACSTTPLHVPRVHWGFNDPAGKGWSEF